MKRIALRGRHSDKFALVADEDFDKINKYKWFLVNYLVVNLSYIKGSGRKNQKQIRTHMHRLVMDAPLGFDVDHIDHDALNNQKSNLRICTHQQNGFNQSIQTRNKSSIYKGVSWCRFNKAWRSYIVKDNKQKTLGYFKQEYHAAMAYDIWAKELFGEFAFTNF
jgi:hypothetical protein